MLVVLLSELLHSSGLDIWLFLELGWHVVSIKVDVSGLLSASSPSLIDISLHVGLSLLILSSPCSVDALSSLELSDDILLLSNLTLHPWVANDISHGEAHVWLELEHGCDQVFELFSEEAFWLAVAVSFPEEVGSLLSEASIVNVVFFGHCEWRMTGIHDEEDDCSCKEIDLRCLIWSPLHDFWGHVSWGSNTGGVCTISISTGDVAGESKVDDFEGHVSIKHDVFWLQISVSIFV